jgi:primosomal protein N' (replication factor Y)
VGLILVDEEHDSSYKQSDPEPRYNARDVAVMRGHFQKSIVVLGSATPSFESYYNAHQGKYTLVKLVRRYGEATLPTVETIDMNREHQKNNWTFLSIYLKNKIQETLDQQRQVILLLNRRGFSISLICKDCGHIYKCPDCSVCLIYHRSTMQLKCHQCGYEEPAPATCDKCGGEQIKYKGTGIQKAEDYLKMMFPQARILRMDKDTTRQKGAHISILERFARQKADILLGTQMVAKGLNFPGVKLVGVLQADTGLHFPDFRASERTFQLLSQVAGRAGRKDSLGEVVIQTYSPGESSIIAAQKHNYPRFYQEEIGSRKALKYPPFSRLMRITVLGKEEEAVRSSIEKVAEMVRQQKKHLIVLGPSPAILTRIKRLYRYSILLKSKSPQTVQNVLFHIRRKFTRLPKSMKLIIDVDPINML